MTVFILLAHTPRVCEYDIVSMVLPAVVYES